MYGKALVTATALLLVSLAGCKPDTITSRCDNESAAEQALKEWMLERLVSPGSAQFSELSTSRRSVCAFMISGYVDSQNTMGALLRTDIRASVDYNLGTGAWEISNIAELLE